jgi:death-on-curing protein
MRYLTVEEVLAINAEVMGGKHALRDRGLLESAVARPQSSAFGADAYPDLVSKAVALLHSLIMNHAFVDGNKRTAVLATLIFLDLNGIVIRWDQQEALEFVINLVNRKVDLEDVKAFLQCRMHSKDNPTWRKPD